MSKKLDYQLFFTIIIIVFIGLALIYSASNIWALSKFHDHLYYVKHQLLFAIIGFIIMIIIINIPTKYITNHLNALLFFSIILLSIVLIPGIGQIRNGSRSWFGIGSFGIQPSEFAKLSLILFISKYAAKNRHDMQNTKKGLLPILSIIFLIILLIMLEPDFGSAFVILLSSLSIILISETKISIFLKLGILGLILGSILIIIAPYRIARITSFLNPWQDPLGNGFQIIQSLYAIGPNGLLGSGYLNSIQKNFYLPEPQTDFIFSIASEEFGFLGILIIITLFLIIFYRSLKVSLSANNLTNKYIAFGLSSSILLQALLNLSVVIGLVPVTGVTLPFISYGGSSLLTSLIAMGIILNISKNK